MPCPSQMYRGAISFSRVKRNSCQFFSFHGKDNAEHQFKMLYPLYARYLSLSIVAIRRYWTIEVVLYYLIKNAGVRLGTNLMRTRCQIWTQVNVEHQNFHENRGLISQNPFCFKRTQQGFLTNGEFRHHHLMWFIQSMWYVQCWHLYFLIIITKDNMTVF